MKPLLIAVTMSIIGLGSYHALATTKRCKLRNRTSDSYVVFMENGARTRLFPYSEVSVRFGEFDLVDADTNKNFVVGICNGEDLEVTPEGLRRPE